MLGIRMADVTKVSAANGASVADDGLLEGPGTIAGQPTCCILVAFTTVSQRVVAPLCLEKLASGEESE